FDAAVGVPNALARRIARNTQHVLDEESGLGHVVDPAAGSWFVESLTSQFADLAWREFRLIEAGGGMVDELLSGRLSGRIAESREERERRVAARELSVTGVSAFANVEESPLQRTSYT